MNWKIFAIKESIAKNDIAVTDRLARAILGLDEDIFDGGPGSGNFGHRGRPGQHGGSLPQGESQMVNKEEAKKGFASNAARELVNNELANAKVGYKFNVRRNKGVVTTYEKTEEGWRETRTNEKTGKTYEDRVISAEEMANSLSRKEQSEPETKEPEKKEIVPKEVSEIDPDDKFENEVERIDPEEEGFEFRANPENYVHLKDEKQEDYALDGGPGSGNFGHKGRPGQVGGSGKGGGNADVKAQYQKTGTKESLEEYTKRIDVMKSTTPKTVTQSNHKKVNGKDMTSTYKKSENHVEPKFNQYIDTEIEDILEKQGFNGVPKVVSKEEFDKQLRENPDFPAMYRTFSAPDKEVLTQYNKDLEEGAWYVDCGIGGSKYGQGMYTAYAPKRQIANIKDIRFEPGGYYSDRHEREIDLNEQVDNTAVKVGDDYFIADEEIPLSVGAFKKGEYIMSLSTYDFNSGKPSIYRVDSIEGKLNEGTFKMEVTDVENGNKYDEMVIEPKIFKMHKVSKDEASRNVGRPMGQMQMYIHHNESRDKRHFGKQDEYDKKIRELSMKDGTDLMYGTVRNDKVPDIVEVDREEVNSAGRNEGFYKIDKNGEKLTDEKFNSLAPGDYLVTYYSRWDDPSERDMRVIHVDENGEMKHLHEWETTEAKDDYEKWKDRNPMIYKCEDVTPEPPEPVIPVSRTRRMTLDPSSKVIRYQQLEKEFETYRSAGDKDRVRHECIEEVIKNEGLNEEERTGIRNLSEAERFGYKGILWNRSVTALGGRERAYELLRKINTMAKERYVPVERVKDVGAYAALKGYDAVVCDNYGMTIVVYNRTKLILDKEDVEVPRREES